MARRGFLALDLPFEVALVSLDLAALLHFFGDWRQLEPLARDTFDRFRLLTSDREAIAALKLWRDAVKARNLTEAVIDEARQLIESRIGVPAHQQGRTGSVRSRFHT